MGSKPVGWSAAGGVVGGAAADVVGMVMSFGNAVLIIAAIVIGVFIFLYGFVASLTDLQNEADCEKEFNVHDCYKLVSWLPTERAK